MRILALFCAVFALNAQSVYFQARTEFPFSTIELQGPFTAAAADFDRDGKTDLAMPSQNPALGITIVFGEGDGTFRKSRRVGTNQPYGWLIAADLNGDGSPDLAGIDLRSYRVFTLLNDGAGGFPSGQTFVAGSSPWPLVAADFNRDGVPDLAVTDRTGGAVVVLIGTGDGGFLTV